MKKNLVLIWMIICLTIVNASKKDVIHAPLDIISLDDITPEERKQIAEFEAEINRHKRSGSGDILGTLKNAIGRSIKKKIGQVAKASAAASGAFSRSSSGGKHEGGYEYDHPHVYEHPHEYEYHHEHPESYDDKSVDWWSLKKSILNTLLQAVKAIKGGVIAVKGQLIKGSGKLISAKGKFISSKGEQITTLGKKLATSAVLVPHHGHPSYGHPSYGHPSYGHPSSGHSGHEESHSGYHYSAPSAPEEYYHGAQSASGSFHNPGEVYATGHDSSYVPNPQAGLLILKKIQSGNDESKGSSYKPLEPRNPSLGTIVGKFFGASSSLDPHKPEPFDYSAVGQSSYDVPKSSHQDVAKDQYVEPAAADYVKGESTHSDSPFEETPNYVNQNFEDFATSDSKDAPQAVEIPYSKFKQLKNPVKAQLMKELSGKTQTSSLEQQSQKINYSTQKPQFGEYSIAGNDVSLTQNSNPNFLQPSQSFNSAQTLNGYSLLDNQLSIPQNFSNFPNSYLNEKPIDPISLADYTQQFGSSPFQGQNSFNDQYTNVQNLQYQTQNVLSNPSLVAQSMGDPNVIGPNLDGQGSLAFGGSFIHSGGPNSGGQILGQPPLGQPTVEEMTVLGNQAYSGIGSFKNYIDHVSSPSRHLQTPKKTYSLSISQPPKPLDPYNDPRISHYKKRKSNISKRQPSRTSAHKPKNPNYDLVKSISYEIGPNGAKRLK